jgi:hypothetical protein
MNQQHPTRPESAHLRALWGPLMARARERANLALKVAILKEHGTPPAVITERLGITQHEIKGAVAELDAARRDEKRGSTSRDEPAS